MFMSQSGEILSRDEAMTSIICGNYVLIRNGDKKWARVSMKIQQCDVVEAEHWEATKEINTSRLSDSPKRIRPLLEVK